MATNLAQICQFLDNRQLNYQQMVNQPYILTGVTTQTRERFAITIKLSEQGRCLKLRAPQLLQVKDHVFMGLFFRAIAHLAYSVKLARFQYNPMDGEVRAAVEFPLEDAPLTEQQFNRCLDSLVKLLDSSLPRLRTILASGYDPGQRVLAEQIWEAMPSALQQQLQEMILRRQVN